MTREEIAELELLSQRSDDRSVIKIEGRLIQFSALRLALERAQDMNWVTLIDVEIDPWDRLVRVFRLTDQGHYRLRCLQQLRDNELGEQ